jgi:hypothetical protein
MDTSTITAERADLTQTLRQHRFFLHKTVHGLTDEQIRARTTVSELCLGAILKHVAATEQAWAEFTVRGPSALGDFDEAAIARHHEEFQLREADTAQSLLAAYQAVAEATDALVAVVDLDAAHPLPAAPWFEPGAQWSARRAFLHIIAETSQHAGHADIIRESIDGAKTMG